MAAPNSPRNPNNPRRWLGPGDLVILTAYYPNGGPQHGDFQEEANLYGGSPKPYFVVSKERPSNAEELAAAITNEQRRWGKFRRIIIIGHAGGEENGPDLCMNNKPGHPDRLFYNSAGLNFIQRTQRTKWYVLRPAIQGALRPGGIVILGSCGYALGNTPAYLAQWNANLAGWAMMLGVPTYALPVTGQPSRTAGIAPYGPQVPLARHGPDGKPLP